MLGLMADDNPFQDPLRFERQAPECAAVIFGANGVSLPFIGLWLRAQGLDGAEIGALLAAPMLGRVIIGPDIALWDERCW